MNRTWQLRWRIVIVLSLLLLLYPVSFGPACWLASWMKFGSGAINVVYRPILCIWARGSSSTGEFLEGLVYLGANRKAVFVLLRENATLLIEDTTRPASLTIVTSECAAHARLQLSRGEVSQQMSSLRNCEAILLRRVGPGAINDFAGSFNQ